MTILKKVLILIKIYTIGLIEIYDDIDKLERSDIEEFKYYNVQEKYRLFLLPAFILIGLEMILKFTLFRSFI